MKPARTLEGFSRLGVPLSAPFFIGAAITIVVCIVGRITGLTSPSEFRDYVIAAFFAGLFGLVPLAACAGLGWVVAGFLSDN